MLYISDTILASLSIFSLASCGFLEYCYIPQQSWPSCAEGGNRVYIHVVFFPTAMGALCSEIIISGGCAKFHPVECF